MATPPPFQSPTGSEQTSRRGLKVFLAIFVFVLVPCGIGGYFLFNLTKKLVKLAGENIIPVANCALSMQAMRDAMVLYANAHGGVLPKAENWQKDIQPFYKQALSKRDFQKSMPGNFPSELRITPIAPEAEWACSFANGVKTGIAFNKDLAGKKLADIKEPKTTILLFEVAKPGTNLAEPFKPLARADSPKILGSNRDWITMPVEGEMTYTMGENDAKMKVGDGNISFETK